LPALLAGVEQVDAGNARLQPNPAPNLCHRFAAAGRLRFDSIGDSISINKIIIDFIQIFFVVAPTTLALINGHLMAQMPSLAVRNISYTLWNFCYNFSVLGLCVQFVYRYLVLNR